MPVQVEDGLAAAGADVDHDAVVREACVARHVRHELEHSLRLVRSELRDLAERVDVTLRKDEQVRVRLRLDVADRDEAIRSGDVVAVSDEGAEQAVAHAATIPSSETAAPRTRTSSPTGAWTSHGE